MTKHNTVRLGVFAAVLYVGTVFAANYFVQHVGTQAFPGGPHTIPIGFGFRAPSGVLFVGLAFTLRDFVQTLLGRRMTVAAILVGAALSYAVAPSLAIASAVAFLVSEFADFAVYTPIVESGRVVTGVLLSNIVGTFVDTFLFLQLAFGSLDFWQGQVIGKLWMTAVAVIIVTPWRRWLHRQLVAVA